VDIIDLNADKLPYLDGRFSLVTCIETIARVEQIRPILREIFRVLEPGGLTVISTPNILNLPSRLSYCMTGFFSRFHPLPILERSQPRGHINPVGYFYLAHSLLETGFLDLEPRIDRCERRSRVSWIILFLPIKIVGLFFWFREKINSAPSLPKIGGWSWRSIRAIFYSVAL
jgi:ubiquinone/menaquinone biosynthesis C-methylase UbiE